MYRPFYKYYNSKKKDLYYLNCNQKFFSNTLFKDKNINDIYEIILKKIINDEFEVQFDNYHLTLTMDVENEKINLILFKTFSYLFEQINELNHKLHKKYLIIILLSFILLFNICSFLFVVIWKPKNNNEYFNIINDQYKLVNNSINKVNDDIININNKLNGNYQFDQNLDTLKEEIFNSIKVQYTKINITHTDSISINQTSDINSVSIFPISGNIVAVSNKTITILNEHLSIIQQIFKAHDNNIIYVDIYDEDNFVTCSEDKNIKTWIKNKNKNEYQFNKIIENAHNNSITKVIYNSKGNLISCSWDGYIKIWELKNGEYENINFLKHNEHVNSLLLLEDENILISSGFNIHFWNITNNNNESIISYNNKIDWNNCIERIDEDKIIFSNDTYLIIYSISKFKKIKEIDNKVIPSVIKLIDRKGIILVAGQSKENISKYNLNIYRKDNFELIQNIENEKDYISDVEELKNHSIISSSWNDTINLWLF